MQYALGSIHKISFPLSLQQKFSKEGYSDEKFRISIFESLFLALIAVYLSTSLLCQQILWGKLQWSPATRWRFISNALIHLFKSFVRNSDESDVLHRQNCTKVENCLTGCLLTPTQHDRGRKLDKKDCDLR